MFSVHIQKLLSCAHGVPQVGVKDAVSTNDAMEDSEFTNVVTYIVSFCIVFSVCVE